MKSYILKRLLVAIPVVFVTISVVFFAFALIPGDPALMFAGPEAPGEFIAALQQKFGTDQPVHIRYYRYLGNLIRGDLGSSFFTGRPVHVEILPRFRNTAELAIAATLISASIGIMLGVVSAVRQDTAFDRVILIGTLAGISIPVFWLGLILMLWFAVNWGLLPSSGRGTLAHLVLPTLSLSVFATAFITRMTRSSILEVIRKDYIRTARAKGLSERIVVYKHALANAMIPVVTVVGLRFGYLLGGAVITEQVFRWPGLGRILVQAVGYRDYFLIQGTIMLFSICFVLINIVVDVTYAILDPRIRYG